MNVLRGYCVAPIKSSPSCCLAAARRLFSSNHRSPPWRVANARTSSGYYGNSGGGGGNSVLYGIVGANVLVFGAWNLDAYDNTHQRFMTQNFTLSTRGFLVDHYIHTLVTHFFSHKDLWHLGGNMFSLWFFGSDAIIALGPTRFLMLYLGGGLVSGAASLFVVPYIRSHYNSGRFGPVWTRADYTRNLGASGAVSAVVAWGCLAMPYRSVYIFPIPIPIQAWLFGLGYIANEAFNLLERPTSNVGHGAHLAGAGAGVAAFFLFRGRR